MMEVEVGEHNVLLVRCDGVYSAISNQCTHYGAPLSKGSSLPICFINRNQVRCYWLPSSSINNMGEVKYYKESLVSL